MKIVVTPPFTKRQKEALTAAAEEPEALLFCPKEEITEAVLADADVILGNLAEPKQAAWAGNLKWIQLNNAGTEGYCEPGVLPAGTILTNATGAYGLAISEHMIACLFMLRKKLHLYYANQQRREWKREGHVGVVQKNRVLVIGLGDIGCAFASRMKALGCYTVGIKRHIDAKPACVEELYGMEALDRLLPDMDVVALSLPGNASTRHVLNRERIGLLSSNAIVLNVGRGSAVDTDALSEALYAGRIAGAALDVTEPEPLPPSHPLWDAPNALITPHISGGYSLPETLEQIAGIFTENLRRFQEGQPLRNVVNMETGYCG